MRIANIACALALAATIGAPPASADDPIAPDHSAAPDKSAAHDTSAAPDKIENMKRFAGKWEGMWRLAMNSGRIELNITADPSQPGTIAVTNLARFGEPPEPLTKVVTTDGKIQFRSSGADNSTMKVSLELKSDDEMYGLMVFDGFTNRCLLKRIQ